ncbi:hypothetical protein ACWGNU_24650 [Paenibacillus lautus]
MDTKDIVKSTGISLTKGAIGAIPYVGTLLNEIFFENRGRLKQERVNRFIEELKIYISKEVNQNQFDFDYIKSEQFSDLFESIIFRISQNRSEEKLHRLKKVLVNQMTSPYETDYTETFLDIASKINEKQIEILNTHRKAEYGQIKNEDKLLDRGILDANHTVEVSNFRDNEYYKLEKAQYMFYVQDLVSKSLLLDDSINRLSTRPYTILKITAFGIEFLRFIENRSFESDSESIT